jgi:HlyD family secretion protein
VISGAEWDRIVAAYETAEAQKNAAYYSMQSAAATVTEATDNLARTTIYSLQ